MSAKIYGIKNCDTMKKAFAWLGDHDVAHEFHDYRAAGIDTATVKAWVRQLGWEKVLNKASTTFKALPESDKAGLDEAGAIALMVRNPTMIKRPMLVTGKTITAGFKPDIYASLFSAKRGRSSHRTGTMSRSTRATLALAKAGAEFEVLTYDYDPDADKIGIQAAEALGVSPSIVLKTLMAEVDGKPVCVVIPSDKEVSMKKLAAAFKGKSANMMKPAAAEKATGYVVGGISPFGQKKPVPTVFEAEAMMHGLVYMNGGQRGLQVKLKPADAVKAAHAIAAAVVA